MVTVARHARRKGGGEAPLPDSADRSDIGPDRGRQGGRGQVPPAGKEAGLQEKVPVSRSLPLPTSQEATGRLYVSEAGEGNPACEWVVAILVVVAGLLALAGRTLAATVLVSTVALATGLVRLVMREHSPWKVRSVAFDATIGIGLGIGLMITYFSIQLML